MKTALFTNFSAEEFVGFWGGKGKKFLPGQSVYMPDYLAKHFAKHLTNRELLKKGLERDTSPKLKTKPDGTEYIENVNFMELFNKAYSPDTDEEFSAEKDSIDVQIEVANKNRAERGNASMPENVGEKAPRPAAPAVAPQDPNGPQDISVPEDDEEEFGENNPNNQ